MKTALIIYSGKQLRNIAIPLCCGPEKEMMIENMHEDLDFVISQDLTHEKDLLKFLSCAPTFFPSFRTVYPRLGNYLCNANLWRSRFRSRAYLERANSTLKLWRRNRTSVLLYGQKQFPFITRFAIRILANYLFFHFFSYIRDRAVLKSHRRAFLSFFSKYEKVLIPYSAMLSPSFDDLTLLAQANGLTVVAIQENWDNLTSKSVMRKKPDLFLVWGTQSEGFLKEVQGYRGDSKVVGAPRFQPYFEDRFSWPTSIVSQDIMYFIQKCKYLLFTGTGDGIDDKFVIDTIFSSELFAEQFSIKNIGLVYRPHPFTRSPIKNTDFQLLCSKPNFLLDCNQQSAHPYHHIPLVQNAHIVINHFSTVLLEGVFANRSVLLPTFIDRPTENDYQVIVDTWEHFRGISELPGVYIARSKDSFIEFLELLISNDAKPPLASADYFCAALDSKKAIFDAISLK